MTAPTQCPTVLDESQLLTYRKDGYAVVRSLIPRESCLEIQRRALEVQQGQHDWPLKHFQIPDPKKFQNPDGSFIPWGLQQPSKCEALFDRFCKLPPLRQAMQQILGGQIERLTDQVLIKDGGIGGQQSYYHQDSYYWRIKPELGCNAWIALNDVDVKAIALGIMPGSHRDWSLTEHERYFDEPCLYKPGSDKPFSRWRIPLEQIDYSSEVVLPMKTGDAAFFTNFTWHRAEPNESGETKMAYAIAYRRVGDSLE